MAYVVAVEQHGVVARRVQALLDDIGDRRLARTREAGEPEDSRPLMLERRAISFAHQERLPMNIGPAPQPKGDHAGRNGMIGKAVDDDERAGLAVRLVGIEGDRDRGG
jgi:hypothetical protein